MSGWHVSACVLLAGFFAIGPVNAAVSEHLNLEKAKGCLAGSAAPLCDSLPAREQDSGVGSELLNSYSKGAALHYAVPDLPPKSSVAATGNLVLSLGAAVQGKELADLSIKKVALVQPRLAVPDRGPLGEGGGTAEVPLPASIWLFGSALVGFVAWSRRRAR